jgi:hypothetical protein
VNPQKAIENAPEVAKMYKKSHGNFMPGEQKQRDYQWNIDKDSFRFGYGEARMINGAAKSIHGERDEPGAFPKTIIVRKTVEDVKATQSDMLGRPRNLGQGQIPVDEDHYFGSKNIQSMGPNTWNAGKCIHGEPTEREL